MYRPEEAAAAITVLWDVFQVAVEYSFSEVTDARHHLAAALVRAAVDYNTLTEQAVSTAAKAAGQLAEIGTHLQRHTTRQLVSAGGVGPETRAVNDLIILAGRVLQAEQNIGQLTYLFRQL